MQIRLSCTDIPPNFKYDLLRKRSKTQKRPACRAYFWQTALCKPEKSEKHQWCLPTSGKSRNGRKPNGLTTNKSTKRSCPGTKAFTPDKTRIFYWACNKLSSVDANGLNHFSRIADAKEAQIRQPDRYACSCWYLNHKRPLANASDLTIPKLKRPARSCADFTAGPVYLCICLPAQTLEP